jgi:hypothetical protein
MSAFILLADSLGTLEPPSEAFAPTSNTADAAASVLEKIISMAIGAVTIVAGLYFILVLIVASFNWLSASGDTGKVKKSRDMIIQGLIGLILVVASYAVIGLIGSIVGLRLLEPAEMLLELGP